MTPSRLLDRCVRWRYVLMTLLAVPAFLGALSYRNKGLDDWLWFEYGARVIAHYGGSYTGGLHLYAEHNVIQIGPPPLLVVAALQWLPPHAVRVSLAAVMAIVGIGCVWSAELTATALVTPGRVSAVRRAAMGAGVVVAPLWAWESGQWEHLDDVMAIGCVAAAMALVARHRVWWLAGALVGVGVASKPWALIVAPILLGLPRATRSKAALVAIAVAGGFWGPFVLSDSGTVHSLGALRLQVSATSDLRLLGIHTLAYAPWWVRPVQMVGGFLLVALVARRRWLAAPLLGFGFRVVTDPQTWPYYGIGPVIGAALLDVRSTRRVPVWTVSAVVVEYGVPAVLPAAAATARLIGFVVTVVAILVRRDTVHAGDIDSPRPIAERRTVALPA